MKNKEEIKDRNRLEVALDHETSQQISFVAYNWDVAASRMEQIAKDREQGLYDDDGTEAMAVFARLERVLSALFALNGRPQAVLLKGFCELLEQMAADERMDREIADMMTAETSELSIQAPTIWKRLGEMLPSVGKSDGESKAVVRELYQKNYIPNMEGEDALKAMQSLVYEQEPDELEKKRRAQLIDGLIYFGENIGKLASGTKQLMATGLACVQMAVRLALAANDLQKKEDADVDAFS